MKPVHCRVKHDPEAGTYGDCIRACVASILEKMPEVVPHFTAGNPGPEITNRLIREYLAAWGFGYFSTHYDGAASLAEVLSHQAEQNPGCVYMLFGRTTSESDHVVVCQGGEIVHDPAWYRSEIVGPGSHGLWTVAVIAKS